MRALRGHGYYSPMAYSSERAEIFNRGDNRHDLGVTMEEQLEALCERVRAKPISVCKS